MQGKIFIPLLLCLLILLPGFRPDERNQIIRWGKPVTMESGSSIRKIIGASDSSFYLLRNDEGTLFRSGNGFIIDRFDPALLQPVSSVQFVPGNEDIPEKDFEDILLTRSGFVCFFSRFNRDLKKTEIWHQLVSFEGTTGIVMNTLSVPALKKKSQGSTHLAVSMDKSKVAAIVQMSDAVEEKATFTIIVYDDQMNREWMREVTLPYSNSEFLISDILIDNSGNTYLLARHGMESKRKSVTLPQPEYKIISVRGQEELVREFDLRLENKAVSEVKFMLDEEQDLICAGYYSDHLRGGYSGSFYLRVSNSNLSVLSSNWGNLQDRTMQQATGSNRNRVRTLENFRMKELLADKEGGIMLISEFGRTYRLCTTVQNGVTFCNNHFVFEDILVTSYNKDGTLRYEKLIPKKQHTIDDGGIFSSFAVTQTDKGLVFFYNDNDRNLDLKKNRPLRVMQSPATSSVAMVTLNMRGETNYSILHSNRDMGLVFRPGTHVDLNDQLFVLSQKGRTYSWGAVAR